MLFARDWRIMELIRLVFFAWLCVFCTAFHRHRWRPNHENILDLLQSLLVEECGSSNPNGNFIDKSEPVNPGPFHDMTTAELRRLRTFLENDPNIRAAKADEAALDSSYLFTADLFLPPKAQVLNYLDKGGSQPARQARVVMFRGDLNPSVVEEYICGPLDNIEKCELLNLPNRRNPVPFEIRPFSAMEGDAIMNVVLKKLDEKIGFILRESYNATFTDCVEFSDCLTFNPTQVGTGLLGTSSRQVVWMANYNVPFSSVHPLDFFVMINTDGSDVNQWFVSKIWYAGRVYNSIDELIEGYNSNSIPIQRVSKPVETDDLYSTLHRRGQAWPTNPQRPPTLVEPDGQRYSLQNKKVTYMGWEFNVRSSALSGPGLFDVRFNGERIVYELGLSEIAVFYSAFSPVDTTDYVDSSAYVVEQARVMIPGADCPETSTLIPNTFMSPYSEEPIVYDAAICLFEMNNGHPLRRHLRYHGESFFGGMMDSALTLRTAMVIGNYDYIIDFIFHQNGILESRVMSTGYIIASPYSEERRSYGLQIEDGVLGNLHLHMMHFKADLDVSGTSNRYETLNIVNDNEHRVAMYPNKPYAETKFISNLKRSEQEALYKYDFDAPKYHIVHNNEQRTNFGEPKAYRIQVNGMAKNLLPEGEGNEGTLAWGRHQIVITKQKDEEIRGSSMYGMFDSLNPVTDFTSFYADDENIVDEDLVFWVTLGLHHIPHTEDLPVTPTAGNHLSFFLLPYNYFKECPSMGSRDAMYIRHKNPQNKAEGLILNRYGNSRDQCIIPKSSLEEDLANNPEQVLSCH